MNINQIISIINSNSNSIFSVTTDHSMQGMGEDVVKIASKNTHDTICYYNTDRNKIYFSKPVSLTVLEELLNFVKVNFLINQTVE
jgi:hypothetical protein